MMLAAESSSQPPRSQSMHAGTHSARSPNALPNAAHGSRWTSPAVEQPSASSASPTLPPKLRIFLSARPPMIAGTDRCGTTVCSQRKLPEPSNSLSSAFWYAHPRWQAQVPAQPAMCQVHGKALGRGGTTGQVLAQRPEAPGCLACSLPKQAWRAACCARCRLKS